MIVACVAAGHLQVMALKTREKNWISDSTLVVEKISNTSLNQILQYHNEKIFEYKSN